MQVTVKGKQMDVGDALRTHITETLTNAVSKYFARPLDATLVLTPDAHLIRADVTVHVARNLTVQAKASATDPYRAADEAIEHAEKRIRRYKRRLKEDHHRGGPLPEAEIRARLCSGTRTGRSGAQRPADGRGRNAGGDRNPGRA